MTISAYPYTTTTSGTGYGAIRYEECDQIDPERTIEISELIYLSVGQFAAILITNINSGDPLYINSAVSFELVEPSVLISGAYV